MRSSDTHIYSLLETVDMEESAFEVMDRAMVKRVSSVVTCNSIMKKGKDKPREDGIKGKSKYVEQSRK